MQVAMQLGQIPPALAYAPASNCKGMSVLLLTAANSISQHITAANGSYLASVSATCILL